MEYLYFLQNLRDAAPHWFNEAVLFVSEFVGGTGGLVLMALIYWCISKYIGTLLMMNFSLSYACNTIVKNIFCIERPFTRDARLTLLLRRDCRECFSSSLDGLCSVNYTHSTGNEEAPNRNAI